MTRDAVPISIGIEAAIRLAMLWARQMRATGPDPGRHRGPLGREGNLPDRPRSAGICLGGAYSRARRGLFDPIFFIPAQTHPSRESTDGRARAFDTPHLREGRAMLTTDWRPNAGVIFENQTFAVGDVHGQAEALGELLAHLAGLEQHGAERELIFLGDLIDRGPDTLGAARAAFAARDMFETVVLLPGNHELMLLAAMKGSMDSALLWLGNGGHDVLDELQLPPKTNWADTFAALEAALPEGWCEAYENGPTHLRRGRARDALFIHAGIHPHLPIEEFLARPRLERDDMHWAWIRQPFLDWQGGWDQHDLKLIMHGHTPATTRPIEDGATLEKLLDHTEAHGCICLDAGAMRRPQVAAVEFIKDQHRLHLRPAPDPYELGAWR